MVNCGMIFVVYAKSMLPFMWICKGNMDFLDLEAGYAFYY